MHSLSFWECIVFPGSLPKHHKKIEPFEVYSRNVITGKPQTLTRDISGTECPICIIFSPTSSAPVAL